MGETKGKLGLILMGRTILSKSLIQFSVVGQGCVLSLLFDLRPNYGGDNEDNGDLLQKVPCRHCCTHASPETSGHSWASLGQSLVGSLLLSPGFWWAQGFVYALQESVSQSCVSSGGSMVGLMVPSSKRAYAIPWSAAPRAPALWQVTADLYIWRRHRNTQRQVWLSLCGVCWCTQVLFEASEHLWWVWGLILNVKTMASHSSTLAWKVPWTEEPGRLQSTGSLRVGHDWATSLSLSCIGEGNGNPLQCSCLENPRDGGAWRAAIYGVAQSQTRLKRLSSSSSNHLAEASPLPLDVEYLFLLWSNILLLMVDQQQIVILKFLQEKMSACPSTLPSWRALNHKGLVKWINKLLCSFNPEQICLLFVIYVSIKRLSNYIIFFYNRTI